MAGTLVVCPTCLPNFSIKACDPHGNPFSALRLSIRSSCASSPSANQADRSSMTEKLLLEFDSRVSSPSCRLAIGRSPAPSRPPARQEVDKKTVFGWRLRFLRWISEDKAQHLSGITEADETSPRRATRHWSAHRANAVGVPGNGACPRSRCAFWSPEIGTQPPRTSSPVAERSTPRPCRTIC